MPLEHFPQEILHHIFHVYLADTIPSFLIQTSYSGEQGMHPETHGPYLGAMLGAHWFAVENIKATTDFYSGVRDDFDDYRELRSSDLFSCAPPGEHLLVLEKTQPSNRDELVVSLDPYWLPDEMNDCPHGPFVVIGERSTPDKRLTRTMALNHTMRVVVTLQVEWQIDCESEVTMDPGTEESVEVSIRAVKNLF